MEELALARSTEFICGLSGGAVCLHRWRSAGGGRMGNNSSARFYFLVK